MTITDPMLRSLIQALSPFERRCLERHLRGIGDSVGQQVFWRIKASLKRRARAREFSRTLDLATAELAVAA